MTTIKKIELLAPAKNLECGMEAINHGADAVYIGSPCFGARLAAGNTLEDIAALAEYAHLFGAKVYVALNTILTDDELPKVEKLIWDLYDVAKIDAIIIQDMGITMLNLPPIALHASTQMDNRTPQKASFLEKAGFQQIVLARELSIKEIQDIHNTVNTPLEAFVHGSLCVCYSGQCYISQALSNRSANKGACAQYCRIPYSLVDAEGEEIVSKKHLLSMKDLNLSEHLEELIDAGVSSLKIEGRLKDVNYVKNVVAYYRQQLDEILARRQEYTKASTGTCTYNFVPQLNKSFNRGFTTYFAHGKNDDMWSIDSPKSLGEPIGKVSQVHANHMYIPSIKKLNNGDGLCFFNNSNELQGMNLNRIDGDKVYPAIMPSIDKNTFVYRNFDQEFENRLAKKTSERKININLRLYETDTGFTLKAQDENNNEAILHWAIEKELAKTEQIENQKKNLGKTGNTIFHVQNIAIDLAQNWFIPMSTISEWRRLITDKLLQTLKQSYCQKEVVHEQTSHVFSDTELTYLGNVMNKSSELFYNQHQTHIAQPAFEKQRQKDVALMFSRHCIKQSLGYCPKETESKHTFVEPLYLIYDRTRLRLNFDCKICEMRVYRDFRQK